MYAPATFPACCEGCKDGRYVFGDFVSGRIFNIPASTQPTVTVSSGLDTGFNISSFGEGNDGELYVVNYGGNLYRINP